MKLNEQEVTAEVIEAKKKELAEVSGTKLVEVAPGEFKTIERNYD